MTQNNKSEYILDLDALKDKPFTSMAQVKRELALALPSKNFFAGTTSGLMNSIALAMKPSLKESTRSMSKQIAEAFKSISDAGIRQLRSGSENLTSANILSSSFEEMGKIMPLPKISDLAKLIWTDKSDEEEQLEYKSDTLFKERDNLLAELVELNTQNRDSETRPYFFEKETHTLIVKKTQWSAINFGSKGGSTDMALLFEIFYDYLEAKGQINGEYNEVFVTAAEIFESLAIKGKTVDTNWIKNTRSNIVNQKIPPELSGAVQISEFDRHRKGYSFKIKAAIFNPNLN